MVDTPEPRVGSEAAWRRLEEPPGERGAVVVVAQAVEPATGEPGDGPDESDD
jgi:hypothetical protein